MTQKAIRTVVWYLIIAILLINYNWVTKAFAAPNVSLPTNLTAVAGNTLVVPIYISGVADSNIGAYGLRLEYDETLLSNPTPEDTGTLSEGNANLQSFINPADGVGDFSVGIGLGFSPVSDGVLIKIQFDISMNFSGSTAISFVSKNEKTAIVTNGFELIQTNFIDGSIVQSNGNTPVVGLPGNLNATPGGTVIVPISITGVAGSNIGGYGLRVEYDETFFSNPTLVSEGTLSEGNTNLQSFINPADGVGDFSIGIGFDFNPIEDGDLIKIRFDVSASFNNHSAIALASKNDKTILFTPGFDLVQADFRDGTIVPSSVPTPIVSLPTNLNATPGGTVVVPINIYNVSDSNIGAYGLRLEYDETVFSNPVLVDEGTLSGGNANLQSFSNPADGVGDFSAGIGFDFAPEMDGELIKIRFNVSSTFNRLSPIVFASKNSKTALSTAGFEFIQSDFRDGSIVPSGVGIPVVSLRTNLNATSGGTVIVPISIKGIAGHSIGAFGLRLEYDEAILSDPTLIDEGTLVEGNPNLQGFVNPADGVGDFSVGIGFGFAPVSDGDLVKIQFIVSDAFSGSSSILFASKNNKTALATSGFELIHAEFVDGSIQAVTESLTVITGSASALTQTTAIVGGRITSDGGKPVTARGVCWSTSQKSTVDDNKTSDGAGTGEFISLLSGLLPNTTYYARAYAINSSGTTYGDQILIKTLAPTRVIGLEGNLSFGNVRLGSTKQLHFSIENSGNSPLNIYSIDYPVGFSGDWNGGQISSSGSKAVSVTFAPTDPVTYSEVVAVNSDKTSGDNILPISGTGSQVTRVIGLSGNLSFGEVDVDTTKKLSFTINNSGNSPLTVNSITYPRGFNGNWSNGSIAPGGSQTITTTFRPTENQTYGGSVTANSDKTSGSNTIAIAGTGVLNPVTYIISGYVKDANNDGIGNVALTFGNSGGTATTDASGFYSAAIDAGWTGMVKATKSGYSFTPANRSYNNITANWMNQNYAGAPPPTDFRVWIDKNANGTYDSGEGVFGATVRLAHETTDEGTTDAQGAIQLQNISNDDKIYAQKIYYEMNNPKAVDPNFSNNRIYNPYYAGSVNGKMYDFVMASDMMTADGTYYDFPGQGKSLLNAQKDSQGNILIRLVHPKIRWNLVVAFEEAQSNEFYSKIRYGFRKYADYMYNFTDGYFALNKVVFVKGAYVDTPQWDYCDVQIKNEEWPNARLLGNRVNRKGHIRMGKVWSGDQPNGYNWYSTLGHESGHYLLGFGDEYMNGNYTKGSRIKWTYRATHDGDPGEPNEFPKNYGVMQRQYGGVHEISDITDYFPRDYFPSVNPDLVTHQFMRREGQSCWAFFKNYYQNDIKNQMESNEITDFSDTFYNNLIDPPHLTGSYPNSDRTKRSGPETMNHGSVNFIEWNYPVRRTTRFDSPNQRIFDALAFVSDEKGNAIAGADVWLNSSDRKSFQGTSNQLGVVKCGSLLIGKHLEAYHQGRKARIEIDAVRDSYALTLPSNRQARTSSGGMVIIAKPDDSDPKHLTLTASGTSLSTSPVVTLSQSHGYSANVDMVVSGANEYNGSVDCQYDSGIFQISAGPDESVSPFEIFSTEIGPASGYYAPNGELELVDSTDAFSGTGSFAIVNSSAPAPPNFGMIQIGNVYSFGFSDNITAVQNVTLNIKLPESGKGADLSLYGWGGSTAEWSPIPGGISDLDYFSVSIDNLLAYPAYALFASPQANDPEPPEPVTGFTASTGSSLWNVDLQWTAPSDNDLFAYDVRFSTLPITEENWKNSITVLDIPEPDAPGAVLNFSVEMPDPGTMYYFGITAIDNAGNVSPLTTLDNPVKSHAADMDGDGMSDLWETSNGLDPTIDDSQNDDDGDLQTNLVEYERNTDPKDSDTDGDGYSDGDEIDQETDPRDAGSFPGSISSVPGDLDCSGDETLADAVIALKILAGLESPPVFCRNDINGDNRIGTDEAVYVLQTVAGVR